MSQKHNKASVKRAGLLRKMAMGWMRKNKPGVLRKLRKKIDKIVPPRRTYSSRPGNNVGL